MSVSPASLPSSEYLQTMELQQTYIAQLESEQAQLMQNQQEFVQRIKGLTDQLMSLMAEKERIHQENLTLTQKMVHLTQNEFAAENEKLKKDLKQCVETIRLLNSEVRQVGNELEKVQLIFKEKEKEKEKLQLELEKRELEEGKIKVVNHLDRFAYLAAVMVALTAFAIFGALSAALLSGSAVFICYQWSKKGMRAELENKLRLYSKTYSSLSQKACLYRLYPSHFNQI